MKLGPRIGTFRELESRGSRFTIPKRQTRVLGGAAQIYTYTYIHICIYMRISSVPLVGGLGVTTAWRNSAFIHIADRKTHRIVPSTFAA